MENINILLITNKGFLNFTYNFIENLKQINFKDKIIIACLDEESYNEINNITDLNFIIVYF
jgi:spore coat polysaccharide biosynthesis protein SpsF (cytidylyltransferase family)